MLLLRKSLNSKAKLIISHLLLCERVIFINFKTIILLKVKNLKRLSTLGRLKKDSILLQLIRVVVTSLEVSPAIF